jgi:hypothetical protein
MTLLRYAVHVAARQNGRFVATNTIICLCPEELLTCVWFVAELRVGLRCQILTKSVDVYHHTNGTTAAKSLSTVGVQRTA